MERQRSQTAIAAIALALGLLAGMPDASAQTLDQQFSYCGARYGQYPPETVIGACSAVIQSVEHPGMRSIAFYNRGAAYARDSSQHDFARAIADYTQALAINPHYQDALVGRGLAYANGPQHDYARAIADYTQAIALGFPRIAEALVDRGDAYQSGPRPDLARAIADYSQAITLNPQRPVAFYNRGAAYLNSPQQDYARAIADFNQAIALQPENATWLSSRCWTRAVWGQQLDQALADCDASLQIANDPGVLDSRGLVHLRRSEWQAAFADYDAAVRGNANLIGSLYGRGVAQLRSGHTAEGRADMAAATARDASVAQTFAGYGIAP